MKRLLTTAAVGGGVSVVVVNVIGMEQPVAWVCAAVTIVVVAVLSARFRGLD